MHVVHQGI